MLNIIHPKTLEKHSIFSSIGKILLKQYVNSYQLGGAVETVGTVDRFDDIYNALPNWEADDIREILNVGFKIKDETYLEKIRKTQLNMIWKISKGDKSAYILGSMHILLVKLYGDQFKEFLKNVTTLVIEHDIKNAQTQATCTMSYEDFKQIIQRYIEGAQDTREEIIKEFISSEENMESFLCNVQILTNTGHKFKFESQLMDLFKDTNIKFLESLESVIPLLQKASMEKLEAEAQIHETFVKVTNDLTSITRKAAKAINTNDNQAQTLEDFASKSEKLAQIAKPFAEYSQKTEEEKKQMEKIKSAKTKEEKYRQIIRHILSNFAPENAEEAVSLENGVKKLVLKKTRDAVKEMYIDDACYYENVYAKDICELGEASRNLLLRHKNWVDPTEGLFKDMTEGTKCLIVVGAGHLVSATGNCDHKSYLEYLREKEFVIEKVDFRDIISN